MFTYEGHNRLDLRMVSQSVVRREMDYLCQGRPDNRLTLYQNASQFLIGSSFCTCGSGDPYTCAFETEGGNPVPLDQSC